VLEIGAGDGAITSLLARRAGYVIAHEIDPTLAGGLRERFGPASAVLVVEGDAFAQPVPRVPFRAVSNVPFHATTRLLRLLLDDPRSPMERAALIVQWEVARKRTRYRPSTLLGLSWAPWWELRLVRKVPAAAFRPPPSVDSGIVVVDRRSEPLLPQFEAKPFRSFVRRGFTHGPRAVATAVELRRLSLGPRTRAGEIGVDEWIALFRAASRTGSRRR
jgi:23S rRNA (adenine-N6)-dimethyltransferase